MYDIYRMKHSIFSLNVALLFMVVLKPGSGKTMADFVDDLLNPVVYDNRVRPGADSGNPVLVKVDMFINSMGSIDEVKMEYTINVFLRQRWYDERLVFTDPSEEITLNYNMYDHLWVPDLFVKNEKSSQFHEITVPNRLLRLTPEGRVFYSQRLSLTLSCGMNLKYYPMDNQTCRISMESYGYTTRDILLEWNSENPIQTNEDLELPEFLITNTEAGDCTTGYVTGAFACLYATIGLQRQFEYYLIQTFVPSCLIVALSWVSFWIDIHSVPARISLSLLTVLTMTTQSSGISSRLPRVSYIKAIDIWMTACLVFVFGGLIEYSIVNVLARKETEVPDKKCEEENEEDDVEAEQGTETPVNVVGDPVSGHRVTINVNSVSLQMDPSDLEGTDYKGSNGFPRSRKHKVTDSSNTKVTMKKKKKDGIFLKMKKNPALAVDMVSRVLFPAVFVVFNIVYWTMFKVKGLGSSNKVVAE